MRKLRCTKISMEDPDDPTNCRYIFELEEGPEHGMRGVEILSLKEDEAQEVFKFLSEKLPKVDGVSF